MMSEQLRVGVIGATGAVGQEFLDLFEKRNFPISNLRLFASERSLGKSASFRGQDIPLELPSELAMKDLDILFLSAGASRSKEWAPVAAKLGVLCVDNSSAFRMNSDVPLVVPEINWDTVTPENRIIANPNCCAILLALAVNPLRKFGKIERLIVSTYQSASGGGAAMMDDLLQQTQAYLAGQKVTQRVTIHPYAFNIWSHNATILDNGANEEEVKVIEETQKILGQPDLRMNVTCVRVPVLRAHCESVTVELDRVAPSESEIRDVLGHSEGLRVVDDREENHFPMPSEASGIDEVLVGRIRRDPSNKNAICLFLAGDQLLKGAALNAVQIAEKALKANLISHLARS